MARIVVIEDDLELRRILVKGCAAAGHEVMEASNGARALELLAEKRVDLVITDIHMPTMDGIEVINLLRDAEAAPRILAISGGWRARPAREVLMDADLLGADRILKKPFTLKELRTYVDELLDDSGQG
jgi:DNA-binding response OmpR family regulator